MSNHSATSAIGHRTATMPTTPEPPPRPGAAQATHPPLLPHTPAPPPPDTNLQPAITADHQITPAPLQQRPTNTPATTNTTPQLPSQTEQHHIFNVPDYKLALSTSTETYRQYVRDLHNKMNGGNTADYHESRIALPRSLQNTRTAHVISKIFTLNPSLDTPAWADVTAEIIGNNLVVGSVTERGRQMIDSLKELKLEPGRATKVPPSTKPNNNYYVELLLPVERDLHVELLEAFLLKFPSSKTITMPGKRPWGTTRRLRLFFPTSTAPREVFTADNESVPIREIVLKCGTAAQVIHKWQRLNQFRPPHLMTRWNPSQRHQSYATAAASTNPTRNASPNAINPMPRQPTSHVPSFPTAQLNPPTAHGTIPTNNRIPPQTNTPRSTPTGETDWSDITPMTDELTTPLPPPTADPRHPTATFTTRDNNNENNPPTSNITDIIEPATTANGATGSTTPRPTDVSSDPRQWQQITRTRSRKNLAPTPPTTPKQQLQRSGSRNRKTKAPANKFTPLQFLVLPAFEDDDTQPIEINLPTKPTKPPRRKFKPTRRALSPQASAALTNRQHVRHPAQTLQHLSPKQKQVVICSKDPTIAPARGRLIRQIALLRAARTNVTPHHIPLEKHADDVFMEHVKTRLSLCHDSPKCTKATEIDIPLRAILDQDEMRMRASIYFAWIDLATRAVLPHLYDEWPDPPIWQNTPLKWLPAEDDEVPCLQDESLATLAACPTLQPVWSHLVTTAPSLHTAIQTAAAQWHLHTSTAQDTNASDMAPNPQQ